MRRKFTLIAEVKTRSPFGWRSSHSWDELLALATRHGDMISIHTDKRWGGSFDLIRRARAHTDKPILAKGIHAKDSDIEKALEAGADWVLVVGRMPAIHQDKCLIEPESIVQLAVLPPGVRAVWNSRDLATGGLKTTSFSQARASWPGWLCQASNVHSIDDIHPDADAVLVGSYLPEFVRTLTT
jgi:hypothetical protein